MVVALMLFIPPRLSAAPFNTVLSLSLSGLGWR